MTFQRLLNSCITNLRIVWIRSRYWILGYPFAFIFVWWNYNRGLFLKVFSIVLLNILNVYIVCRYSIILNDFIYMNIYVLYKLTFLRVQWIERAKRVYKLAIRTIKFYHCNNYGEIVLSGRILLCSSNDERGFIFLLNPPRGGKKRVSCTYQPPIQLLTTKNLIFWGCVRLSSYIRA